MPPISYRRHRFPAAIIQNAIWLHGHFTLSFRDVEGLLAECGIEISCETVWCWVLKFGGAFARSIRRDRHRPHRQWYLDEMIVTIKGEKRYPWRAVDAEGELLDFLVQSRRNAKAARRLMRKLLKNQGFAPSTMVTDKLRSYGTAIRDFGLRVHISRFAGESARYSASSHLARRKGSSPYMPPSTICSTANAT